MMELRTRIYKLTNNPVNALERFPRGMLDSVYLTTLYQITDVQCSMDVYLSVASAYHPVAQRSLSATQLQNRVINVNRSLWELTTAAYAQLRPHLNQFVFLQNSTKSQMRRILSFREDVLQVDPIMASRCVLYSGASLLLYGSTYTRDIDVLFYDMSPGAVQRNFGGVIWRNRLDVCIVYNGLFLNTSGQTHHNAATLSEMTSEIGNNFAAHTVNMAGINVFSPRMVQRFYELRFDHTPKGSKHYVMLDFFNLYHNNLFPKFTVRTGYCEQDLVRFAWLMYRYNQMRLSRDHAIDIITKCSNAVLCTHQGN